MVALVVLVAVFCFASGVVVGWAFWGNLGYRGRYRKRRWPRG